MRRAVQIVAAAALLATAAACGVAGNAPADTPPQPSPYAAVARGRVDTPGGLIQIAASRDGIVRDVRVEEGDRVRRGDILAVQDSSSPQLALRQAEAEVAEARARLVRLETELAAARREAGRLAQLVADAAAPQAELDAAHDRAALARADLLAARLAVETAAARADVQRDEVEQRIIRAPIDGVIARRNAQPGVGASTLNVSTMFTLIPDGPRIVRADVEERFAAAIRRGQEVRVSPEAEPERSYRGVVLRRAQIVGQKRAADAAEPGERADERVVEVVIETPRLPLLIGQRVLVRFEKATPP